MLRNTIEKYLLREILVTWGAVTLVLLLIMLGNVLAGSLGRASEGNLSADLVFIFVAVKSVGLLVTLIPLGLYLGILLAFGRLYRDSEMSALFACGVGLVNVFRPAMVAGAIGVAIITALTIWVNPWAAGYEQRIKAGLSERSALDFLTAGKFVESQDATGVFFIQSANEDKTHFEQVFVHRAGEDGSRQVEIAESAYYESDDESGDEFMIFRNGQTATGTPGEPDYIESHFETHGVLIPRIDPREPRLRAAAKSLSELWASDSAGDKAELQWRISIPLASLILAMLAVPLSHTSPRQGRYAKIAVAILIYIPYSNLLVLARKWLADEKVPMLLGLWWVHGVVLCVLLYLLIRRTGWTWFRLVLSGRSGKLLEARA
ncbi:LPS export ABC transporter permease LptF [Granulosicoccaceae sp. 1_MG-2023]|nr:LPS export ABC transporter permease LptF [Granulosicoccaceae sp. 1_MG-2023]